jgi:hypothetical protein
MKELKTNFKAVKMTDSDAKLVAALQEDMGAETESEVFREAIHELARLRKVRIQSQDCTKAGIKFVKAGVKTPKVPA